MALILDQFGVVKVQILFNYEPSRRLRCFQRPWPWRGIAPTSITGFSATPARSCTSSGPYNPEIPHGASGFHEVLIPKSPKKPLRIWMSVSDRDNLNTRDNYHDWVLANGNMAKVLAAKGHSYQFVFAKNAGHCDRGVMAQTLLFALEYVWQGYLGSADRIRTVAPLVNIHNPRVVLT
jgi:hypothetical protein